LAGERGGGDIDLNKTIAGREEDKKKPYNHILYYTRKEREYLILFEKGKRISYTIRERKEREL